MKRLFLLLLAASMLLPGCQNAAGPEEPSLPQNLIAAAWVDEVNENSVEVTTDESYSPFTRAVVDLSGAQVPFNLFPGQKIELELLPDLMETDPVQAAAVSIKLLEESDPFRPAADLLREYGEDFTLEGIGGAHCFAIIHGRVESGQELADAFYARVEAGLPARLLILQATVEGDPLFTALCYDGQTFRGIYDSSRDRYRGDYPEQRTFEYPVLKRYEPEEGGEYVCLLNDPTLTHEQIMESMLSSSFDARIDHEQLYYISLSD